MPQATIRSLEGDHVSICKLTEEDQNWINVSESMQAINRVIVKEPKTSIKRTMKAPVVAGGGGGRIVRGPVIPVCYLDRLYCHGG